MDVLVVDDDLDSRTALVQTLTRAGLMVWAVENGLQALATLRELQVGAIVSDLRMPFLDGCQLFDELRAQEPGLATRVVFVTAYADDPELAAFLQLTGQPVIRKPYEVAELVQVVRDVLGRPGGQLPDLPASLARARWLPEAYRALPGPPLARVTALVHRYWSAYAEDAQHTLIQELLPVLEAVGEDPAALVSDMVRDVCARLVESWLRRREENEGHDAEHRDVVA